MHLPYRSPYFRHFLDHILPSTTGLQQFQLAASAERILAEARAQRAYRTADVVRQIVAEVLPSSSGETSAAEQEILSGTDVCHDLRQLIEDLTDSAALSIDAAGEPVHTVEDLSQLFDVSTKTISRWRRQGLI